MTAAATANEPAGATPDRDDSALLVAYRGGAEAAFAELVRRHQIAVFRLLLGITSDADEAELLCEQVFFEAARRAPDLPDTQPFAGWVIGLAREAAKKANEKRPPAPKQRTGPRPKDPKALVKHEVRSALTELSGDERVALILADLEGDSFESIAQTLGTSASEAELIVATARTKFERGLAQSSDAGEPQAAPPPELLAPGTLVGGRFRVELLLGKGGMGAVYRAFDTETQGPVALKTLLPASQQDAHARRRFAREAEIIQRLQHPNFVRLVAYGEGSASEPSFVVMELLDGEALNLVLQHDVRLPPRRALHIVRHLLHGLCFAHAQGVIHRDLKPENVMLLQQGEDPDFAKLLDLGIAKLTGPEDARRSRLTQQGELIGTPLYISPEMLRGEPIDARADLYSLTVVLYEMLAARPPFEASTATALFAMHLVTPPPPLAPALPELAVPEQLEQLLQRGLAKEPNARIASADSYLARVEDLLKVDWERLPRGEPGQPPRRTLARPAPAPEAPAQTATTRRPALFRRVLRSPTALVTVVLSVLALIGLVYWVTRDITR